MADAYRELWYYWMTPGINPMDKNPDNQELKYPLSVPGHTEIAVELKSRLAGDIKMNAIGQIEMTITFIGDGTLESADELYYETFTHFVSPDFWLRWDVPFEFDISVTEGQMQERKGSAVFSQCKLLSYVKYNTEGTNYRKADVVFGRYSPWYLRFYPEHTLFWASSVPSLPIGPHIIIDQWYPSLAYEFIFGVVNKLPRIMFRCPTVDAAGSTPTSTIFGTIPGFHFARSGTLTTRFVMNESESRGRLWGRYGQQVSVSGMIMVEDTSRCVVGCRLGAEDKWYVQNLLEGVYFNYSANMPNLFYKRGTIVHPPGDNIWDGGMLTSQCSISLFGKDSFDLNQAWITDSMLRPMIFEPVC